MKYSNFDFYQNRFKIIIAVVLLLSAIEGLYLLLRKKNTMVNPAESMATFSVEKQGLIIRKSQGKLPPTISVESVEIKNLGASLSIPVRVSVALHSNDSEPSYQFETGEQSAVYAEYLKNKAALYGAKKSFARLKYLVENQAAAGKELNDAQVQLQQMSAALDENKNRLRMLGIQIEKLADLKLNWILIIGDIPETKLNRVKEKANISLEFNSFPNEIIEAQIDSISDMIDPVSRTAKILLKIKNPLHKLKPGMYGHGHVELDNLETLAVPNSAIVMIGEADYIFKQVDDNTFERVKVGIGIETDIYTQIVAGLKQGDKIVVNGANLFKGLSFGY